MPDLNPRVAEILREHRKWWSVQSAVATCTGPGCDWSNFGTAKRTDDAHAQHQAELIGAAVRPRIETPEQLDALQADTIVRDDIGEVGVRETTRRDGWHWWRLGCYETGPATDFTFPVQVLWTPEVDRG